MGALTSPASVVYTDASRHDVGELSGVRLDLEVGDTDDFQLEAPASYAIAGGSLVYVDGTSYGGIVDHRMPTTGEPTVRYTGRTWAGVMAERVVVPPEGRTHYEYDCDANELLRALLPSLGLSWLFEVPAGASGVHVKGRFDRYTDLWSGLRKAARAAGARVSVEWGGRRAALTMVPRQVVEASPSEARATVDEPWRAVNHLVCLGQGEGTDRVVLHLYADAEGAVSRTQSLFGAELREATYDYSNADEAELLEQGTQKLRELQERGTVTLDAPSLDWGAELGDLVRVTDETTDATVTAEVTRLVVRVEDGQLSLTCDAGSATIRGGVDLTGASESDGLAGARAREALAEAALARRTADDVPIVTVVSSNGTVFKRNVGVSTTLVATVYTPAGSIETAEELRSRFGAGAYLEWAWSDLGEDGFHALLSADPRISRGGFALTVTPDDIDTQAAITCSLIY